MSESREPVAAGRRPALVAKLSALALCLVLLPALGLLLLEGASSVVLVARHLRRDDRPRPLEMTHSQYDSLLGWANKRNVAIPNMYGPGVSLHTNSEGFRGLRDIAPETAPGRLRVVCSGDSFTLGYGVDDDHTWCALLATKNDRIETVNMGEAGYGIDQAYLWYKRDGIALEHAVHVFAYIAQDFARTRMTDFNGYPKPTLSVHEGHLVVQHVPVPRRPDSLPWGPRIRRTLAELRLYQLVRNMWERGSRDAEKARVTADSVTWQEVNKIIDDLVRINRAKHSTLVVVHLPLVEDHWSEVSARWRAWAQAAAERGDFVFIDLVDEFKRLPRDSIPGMFVLIERPDLPIARWHYTAAGNRWVADRLYQHLLSIPQVARRLHTCEQESGRSC